MQYKRKNDFRVSSFFIYPAPSILHPLYCLLSWTLTTQKRVGRSLCLSWRQGFTWSWRRLGGWRFLQESSVCWVKYVMNECKLSEIVGELVRQERGDLAFSVAFDVRTDDPGTVISKQSFRRQTANFRRRNNCSKRTRVQYPICKLQEEIRFNILYNGSLQRKWTLSKI